MLAHTQKLLTLVGTAQASEPEESGLKSQTLLVSSVAMGTLPGHSTYRGRVAVLGLVER